MKMMQGMGGGGGMPGMPPGGRDENAMREAQQMMQVSHHAKVNI